MNKERLIELRDLCNKATLGPWEEMSSIPTNVIGYTGIRVARCDFDGDFQSQEAHHNAAFIAAARQAIPELLDEVEKLRKLVKVLAEDLRFYLETEYPIESREKYPDSRIMYDLCIRPVKEAMEALGE